MPNAHKSDNNAARSRECHMAWRPERRRRAPSGNIGKQLRESELKQSDLKPCRITLIF
jgi:hypothetical protein